MFIKVDLLVNNVIFCRKIVLSICYLIYQKMKNKDVKVTKNKKIGILLWSKGEIGIIKI